MKSVKEMINGSKTEVVYCNKTHKLILVEPIGDYYYLIGNEDNEFQLVKGNNRLKITDDEGKDKTIYLKHYNLDFESYGKSYQIKVKSPLVKPIYNYLPNEDELKLFLDKGFAPKDNASLFFQIVNNAKVFLDLETDADYVLLALFVMQTYFSDFLDSVFLLAIDGDKGSGKTSVLEFLQGVGCKYVMTKNITGAGLMRSIESEGLNVGYDEIDELEPKQRDEVFGVLRGSQRSGNKALRLESTRDGYKTLAFDTKGSHSYCYRGGVEDALESRSLSINMESSDDEKIAPIKAVSSYQLRKLASELYFLRLYNYLYLYKSKKEFTEYTFDVLDKDIMSAEEKRSTREKVYNHVTKNLSFEQKEYLEGLSGRLQELYLVMLNVSKVTSLELIRWITQIFERKKALLDTSDGSIENEIKLYLSNKFLSLRNLAIEETNITGSSMYYTTDKKIKFKTKLLLSELNSHLKDRKFYNVTDNHISKILRSLGAKKGNKSDGANYQVTENFAGVKTNAIIFDKKLLRGIFGKEYTSLFGGNNEN